MNYTQIIQKILSTNNNFQLHQLTLSINFNGDIRYYKPSKSGGYSKIITAESLMDAITLFIKEGMAAINRKWFNQLPEASSRGCNLNVIRQILLAFCKIV